MTKKHVFSIFTSMLLLFSGSASAYSLQLPESLSVIQAESFKGDIHLEKLVLHDNITRIESQAFAGTDLHSIYCEDISAIDIAPDAFDETLFVFPPELLDPRLVCGTEGQIKFTRHPNPEGVCYTYACANPYAVEVDENGHLRALRSGETEITITDSDGTSITLTVVTEKWADSHPCISMAHRGASGYFPDNSLIAFRAAHGLNADMIELDVRRTADHQLVCCHDGEISINNRISKISECTLKEILTSDENICSFAQALTCIRDLGDIKLMVELKDTGIEEDVLTLVEAAGMADRSCYGSFNWDSICTIKALDPNAETVFIANNASLIQAIFKYTSLYNTDAFSISKGYLSEGLISKIHLAGKKIYGWTINTKEEIAYYKSLGLDGITSNYPDRV